MIPVLYVQGSAERAGAERMLLYLLKHLDLLAFAPTVAFLAEGPFVEEVRALRVPVALVGSPHRLREIWRWGEAIKAIRGAIRDTGAQLVHANGEKMSILAGRAARAEAVPSVAWLHDAPGAGGPAGWLAQLALAASPHDAVVTCSRWMAAAFNRRLRLGAVAIPNGLDLSSLPGPNTSARRIRAEAGWPDGCLVVSHFARLQRWKGTETFLSCAAQLARRFHDMRFIVVGGALYGREADYAESLLRLATELGLDGKVLFTGYRADALDIMAESDIVVHCSLRPDPFPTVVLEGMALGRPVVATMTNGPDEALENGRTGLLVQPGDADAMSRAVEQLACSPELARRMGDEARKVARQRFAADRMASEFESLYRGLLGPRAGR